MKWMMVVFFVILLLLDCLVKFDRLIVKVVDYLGLCLF